ncbi:hypothetical protein DV736_g1089, partial [Chaetothyriales sp. CBS 134916]
MPSSSLFQRSSITLASALLLASSVYAAAISQPPTTLYKLDTEYSGSSFFDGFNFFTGADPTHGFVDYLSYSDAQSAGLISTGSSAIMKVDDTTVYEVPPNESSYAGVSGVGRKSVRIESQKSWTHALIIADFNHLPTSSVDGCGTWPAFWTLGSGDWPYNGELDIIEGANDQAHDLSSAHTGDVSGTRQCKISNSGGSGTLVEDNCNLFTTGPGNTSTNTDGCGVSDTSAANYGAAFNSNGGGVYAMDWTSGFIKLYFFPRGSIPSDISYGWPDPSNWGTPYAVFGGDGLCDIDANFADMRIIFDNTFCGDFGSATWGSGCAAKTGVDQCYKYVPGNPSAFTETYWDVSYVKVYQQAVKAAYRVALLTAHPDRNAPHQTPGLPTVDEIVLAYKVLSDDKLRAEYDQAQVLAVRQQEQLVSNFEHGGIESYDLEDLSYDDGGSGGTGSWFHSCRCGKDQGYVVTEADLEAADHHQHIRDRSAQQKEVLPG